MRIRWRSAGALLTKDVKLQRTAFAVLVLFELFTFATFEAQFPAPMRLTAGVFLQGIAAIGTFVMAYRAIATEEASSTIQFLKSLPLTNDEIYGSKFLFMVGYVVLNSAALNLIFFVSRPLLPWETHPLTGQAIIIGLVVQLVFAVILVSIATLTTSEKAIWVPFPLVILLLNAYTVLTSDGNPITGATVFDAILGSWQWYSAGVVVLLAAVIVAVVRQTGRKTTLVA